MAALVASIPLSYGALYAARPFPRAASRYRILGAAFLLIAAVGPLTVVAAAFRAAPSAASVGSGERTIESVVVLAAPAAVALCALVASWLLLRLAVDVVRLRRVKQQAELLGTVAVRRARVGTSETVVTPTAIGYLHPAVLVPEGFRTRVDAAEWEAVLAHECAHLARLDDWAKAMQSAILRAEWWVPGLWILSRGIDLERELASDERAALATGPRRYAACLLRLATGRFDDDAVAPALWGRRSHVAIRVERLLRPVAGGRPLLRAAALGAFTAAGFAVVAGAVVAVPGSAHRAIVAAAHRAHVAAHPLAHRNAARFAYHLRRSVHAEPTRKPATVAYVMAERSSPSTSESRPVTTVETARAPLAPAVAPRTGVVPRRLPERHADLKPVELAFGVAPRARRCATCFGPLRSPDDPAVFVPAPHLTKSAAAQSPAAVAADDPTSGPVDLGSALLWYRLPSPSVQIP